MAWIKMRTELDDDPRVIRIARDTKLDVFAVVGRLHNLWSWADSHTRNGKAPGVDSSWIDERLKHVGFAESMVGCGWLVLDSNGLTIPRFSEHNGATAKRRAEDARRKSFGRTSAKCPQNVRTVSAKERTRQDKNRLEENREEEHQTNPEAGGAFASGLGELVGRKFGLLRRAGISPDKARTLSGRVSEDDIAEAVQALDRESKKRKIKNPGAYMIGILENRLNGKH